MYSIFMFREQECGLDVTLARATGCAVQVPSHSPGSTGQFPNMSKISTSQGSRGSEKVSPPQIIFSQGARG